jgi:hypothetical protein
MTAIEGQASINFGEGLQNLSEQFLIDCFGQFFADVDFCSDDIDVDPQMALDFLLDTAHPVPQNW